MKTVGIIGGLGPETTAEFYLKVISLFYQKDKTARPPILLWSVPLNYQIESDLITKAIGEERYIPYLTEAAKRLEDGGADFIVMPCNSVHVFIEEVRAAVNIPVLSIVEETAKYLKVQKIQYVGLLATKTTIQKKLYDQILTDREITIHHLYNDDQEEIGQIINRLVLKEETAEDRDKLLEMINNFSNQGISTVLLACTDLQLLVPEMKDILILDTM